MSRELKVGLLVLAALAVLVVAVFSIGGRDNLFAKDNRYFTRFQTVNGLAKNSPVQLNGVVVGSVGRVVLPQEIEMERLTVWIQIDRRYADRVRQDSTARIKTVGLLGDKYVEISSGSPDAEVIPDGGEILAAPTTDVDQLIASGEDVAENVLAISSSLRNILARMEAGEGILGELTTDSEAGRRTKEALVTTLETVRSIAAKIETGEGTLAKLLNDDELAVRLDSGLGRLETLLSSAESGDGAVAALLHDPELRDGLAATVADLRTSAASLRGVAEDLTEGEGLLPRLVGDEAYGREVSEEIRQLVENLNALSAKLERGDGSVAQLINDPAVVESLRDILVGIDESRLLRWLVRSRQRKGIEVRYDEAISPGASPESPEAPTTGNGGAGG